MLPVDPVALIVFVVAALFALLCGLGFGFAVCRGVTKAREERSAIVEV